MAQIPAVQEGTTFSDQMVWDQLKSVYDPEIPVNIVDLGLVYSCVIAHVEQGGNRIHIKMSMTAPGCGMGNVLKADVESRLSRLPCSKGDSRRGIQAREVPATNRGRLKSVQSFD
jgi:metal-sulfur cluster biosynthetic enzyme